MRNPLGVAWHVEDGAIGASPDDVYLWRETGWSFGVSRFAVIDRTGTVRSAFDDLTVYRSLASFEDATGEDRRLYFESSGWPGFEGGVGGSVLSLTDWFVFGPMNGFDQRLAPGRNWATVPQRNEASTHSVAVMAYAVAARYQQGNPTNGATNSHA